MACNSPPSPAVWENNNSSNGNNNSSNHSSGSGNNPNVSNGSVKNSAMLDPTSRGQVPYQPPVDSPPAYMGEYTHQNWYQQQGAHLGLSQSGQVHHAPPTAPSATQSMGAVYWCRKMDNISTGVLGFTWGFFFFWMILSCAVCRNTWQWSSNPSHNCKNPKHMLSHRLQMWIENKCRPHLPSTKVNSQHCGRPGWFKWVF